MSTMASVSIGGVSQKSLINHSLNGFWSHVVWVGVVRRVLTTRPACHSSLVSCLSSLGKSLPSVPYVYGQSLEALLSQPTASGSESHVPGVVFEEEYPITVAVLIVHGAGSCAFTLITVGLKSFEWTP
ncbi:hypothetical protein Tco_0966688 [Tanacetum coccineum]